MSSSKVEEKEDLLLHLNEIKTTVTGIEAQLDVLAGHFEKTAAAASLATNVMSLWTKSSYASSPAAPRQFSVHRTRSTENINTDD
ncbi:hypothetical protein B9G98_00150 [Wickerhamiella sorbophila]|uniref:Uncharacterized protein n=1 Tax=Wickerhamiella sorbophila TaxID=45607 RepID=A0A2T0FC39_9ASCO|nr:hypothetical protein B9G98_00150 [Wickerhamiella sorbophila]PRT52530.1 hypothetical protein B9G98_00150 [Wickerhamiella sorbophila]